MKRMIVLFLLVFSSVVFADTVRVIYNQDGSVSVIYPAKGSKLSIAQILDEATPPDAEYDDIDSSSLPKTDRKYWTGSKGNPITIDSSKKAEDQQSEEYEALIEDEKNKIIEQQAITNLKQRGALPQNFQRK